MAPKRTDKLKAKRDQCVSALGRIESFLNNLSESNISKTHTFELKSRLDKLPSIWEQFEAVQGDIEANSQFEEEARIEFETTYFRIHSHISEIIDDYKYQNFNSSSSGPHRQTQTPQIQLPLISLPKFNGDYDKWLEFRDSFTALVDSHPHLSNISKFHHLKTCLHPEVLETIKGIPVSAEGYPRAWQKLIERYERSHLISTEHVNAILNYPRVTKESSKALRNLHNSIENNLQALRNLQVPVQHWDLLLIPILSAKLDSTTLKEWEQYSTRHKEVGLQNLLTIINNRAEYLEKMEKKASPLSFPAPQSFKTPIKSNYNKIISANHAQSLDGSCKICGQTHPPFKCEAFLKLSIRDRIEKAKGVGLCLNCLKSSHISYQCRSSKCKKCGKSHNTLLHLEPETKDLSITDSKTEPNSVVMTQIHSSGQHETATQVLLPTAVILVIDQNKQMHKCRALLDSGAMSNFISTELCKKIGLPIKQVHCSIRGVGQSIQTTHSMVEIRFKSLVNSSIMVETSCLVMDKITSNLPMFSFDQAHVKFPQFVKLADPNFNTSSTIDILLGSSVFWDLLLKGRIKVPRTGLTLQETKLGWVVGGQFANHCKGRSINKQSIDCLVTYDNSLENQIKQFWEIEEVDSPKAMSSDDQYCEDLFLKTHARATDGHYIVQVPFKPNLKQIGDSREAAIKRFNALERKLLNNSELYNEYRKTMDEYIQMGHMKEINENIFPETASYYIPHHAVIKKDSITTKTRVVFDASMKSTSGLSLNDVQYIGPPIQNELFSILMNFRLHKFVICGDISKMYRMIWLHNKHKHYHRIFWRDNHHQPLKCYELQTVTFGTASAPYLAIRCLKQVAIEYETIYPKASRIIKDNFYVDDLVFGTETISELINLQHEICSILMSAGFQLRKWLCNHDDIYNQLKLNPSLDCNTLEFGTKTNKTLGIIWNAQSDKILYTHLNLNQNSNITKRIVLSELSKLFDPLGLLGPIITVGKLLMQQLWQREISWDETLPTEYLHQWSSYRNEINNIPLVNIKRKVLIDNCVTVQLHGFCDASEKAYGATVFIRSEDSQGNIQTTLLCSKGRVAPLKVISIPKLELCAALLLAKLVNKVLCKIEIEVQAVHYWTDSSITLAWLRSHPGRWKTFVANRVSEIQQLTNISCWHHVASADNPADLVSRGASINTLLCNQLWWSGPSWINSHSWLMDEPSIVDVIPEEKTQKTVANTITMDKSLELINRYSSWKRLLRVISFCLRFKENCSVQPNKRQFGELTVEELNCSSSVLIRLMQKQAFSEEYSNLKQNKPLTSKSHLLSLNPFMDDEHIIRVGGRLGNSKLKFESKHQIILASNHSLSKLLIQQIHADNLHCGPTTLLSIVREKYWPINGRNLIRGITRKCKICFLAKPRSCRYLMGQLPSVRVTQYFPFQNVGVDYAGPILIKDRKTRNYKTLKAYICLFICLATKAIHIECVTELTTEGFLSCLRRFVGRRGKPSNIYSDNGTNFVGAHSEIKNFYKFLKDESDPVQRFLSNEQIRWHFIPARTPTFGGIWEAAIKNVKTYLNKTMKNIKFTYEELSTLLCQIEAVINSRPLTPLSADPSSLTPLTPGHFLIGRSLTHHPEISYPSLLPASRLKQFHLMNQILHHFWRRWSTEYISQLQTRSKWKQSCPDDQEAVKAGKMVLVKEENTPVLQWPLGRITQVHPGSDGIIRTVTVQMRGSCVKRGISKICVLPED